MSRLRASLSKSPLDQTIQSQVATAERAIQGALRALQGVKYKADPLYPPSQVNRVRRDLERAMGALSNVHRVTPAYDPEPEQVMRPVMARVQSGQAPPVAETPEEGDAE